MAIVLKRPAEIEAMRSAGRVAAEVAAAMVALAGAGVTTGSLDQLAAREMARRGAASAILHGQGGCGPFPAHTCVSVNDEALNGVPGGRVLRDGDIVTMDVSVMLGGWCASRAVTVGVGAIGAERRRLIEVADECLARAIEAVAPMRKWSQIARLIQSHAEASGFGVVREFVGHGIGRAIHEEPRVANFVDASVIRGDFALRAGMTLTIEPILTAGSRELMQLDDNWTVATRDGRPAAHVRHTIAVTDGGADVLTA